LRSRSAPTWSASTAIRPRPRSCVSSGGCRIAAGRRRNRRFLAAPRRRLVQRRRSLGPDRSSEDARDQFLRAQSPEPNDRAASARRRRDRQCRVDRRIRLARHLERAKSLVAAPGFADLGIGRQSQKSPKRTPTQGRRNSCCYGPCRPPISLVQGSRIAGQRRQPGAGGDADPHGISPDLRRSPG